MALVGRQASGDRHRNGSNACLGRSFCYFSHVDQVSHIDQVFSSPMSRRARRFRCPRCGRPFPKESSVLKHMNQPYGVCSSWTSELDRASQKIIFPEEQPPSQPTNNTTNEDILYDDMGATDGVGTDETAPGPDEMAPGPNETAPGPTDTCREFFPGASKTYGSAPSFMDAFDADLYAKARITNIYYPFTSRADWEMGSWLLRSGLSMRAIDEFLRLEMVCYFNLC